MIDTYDLEVLKKSKTPYDKDSYLGIEIEFLSCVSYKKLAEWIIKNDLQYVWNLGHDGSIESDRSRMATRIIKDYVRDANGYRLMPLQPTRIKEQYVQCIGEGYELRILTKEKDLMKTLKQVDEFIKMAKGWVNNTCGLHVHLDMRYRNVNKAANLLANKQSEMFKMVANHRWSNQYCKMAGKKAILSGIKGRGERYRAINTMSYSARRTIEIRLHEATLATGQIALWCKYLISVVNGSKLNKQVGNYVKQKITTNAA